MWFKNRRAKFRKEQKSHYFTPMPHFGTTEKEPESEPFPQVVTSQETQPCYPCTRRLPHYVYNCADIRAMQSAAFVPALHFHGPVQLPQALSPVRKLGRLQEHAHLDDSWLGLSSNVMCTSRGDLLFSSGTIDGEPCDV